MALTGRNYFMEKILTYIGKHFEAIKQHYIEIYT